MVSRSGSCRATPVVRPGFCSCKAAASAPLVSRLNSKSDKLGASKIGSPASSYAITPAQAKSTLALKYSKADLMRILKILLKTKGQEPKTKVLHKQPLKAKIPDVYFKKLHIDCYQFCQQCEDHFEIAGAIESNHTPFTTLFLYGKINFWWYQYQKQLERISVF